MIPPQGTVYAATDKSTLEAQIKTAKAELEKAQADQKANEEKIKKSDGERILMTFEGDSPFFLVEETANVLDEFTVIPTNGEPYRLMDTLGVMTDNSLSWVSNGIEYYLVSDVLSSDEMVKIAESIYTLPTMK